MRGAARPSSLWEPFRGNTGRMLHLILGDIGRTLQGVCDTPLRWVAGWRKKGCSRSFKEKRMTTLNLNLTIVQYNLNVLNVQRC